MRKICDLQQPLFGKSIHDFELDINSRDEIPQLLMGLQHVFNTPDTREKIFDILKGIIPIGINPQNGRPGMDLWKIFVLGTLRLNCNWDFDKVCEIANEHRSVRVIMGHDEDDFVNRYALQTIKDNLSLLTPEILDRLNQVVVEAGHDIVGKESDSLRGRCDSFVLETDVHFPTDINLLFDAVRKIICLLTALCSVSNISWWRQSRYNLKKIKKLFSKIRKLKRSNSKNKQKIAEKEELIKTAYEAYLNIVRELLILADITIDELSEVATITDGYLAKIFLLGRYMDKADLLIDQIKRRIMDGEKIPHDEKIFSIFEEHTEWISKGKAGVPQELGLRVCILEDQFGFILHHQVLEKLTDDKVTLSMVQETKERFKNLSSCSFDKGFYTPENKIKLKEMLDHVILPKKGKLSIVEKEEEGSEEFIKARHMHSAVESAINALEQHGLDRCLDHGIAGFKRYVALAVVARNLQIVGRKLQKKEQKRRKRLEKPRLVA